MPDHQYASRENLAKLLDLPETSIPELCKLGMPREGKNRFNAMLCVKWYIRHLRTNVSLDDLAEMFGLTPRRVNQLAKEGKLPRTDRGNYPFKECVRARIDALEEEITKLQQGDETEADARRRKAIADAGMAEIEFAEMRGEVIAVEDARQMLHDAISATVNKRRMMSKQIAPRLAGKSQHDIEAILEENEKTELSELAGVPEHLRKAK